MKIRAKTGYNIVINDLKIALSTNGKIIEVDEQQFHESSDAKQLMKFIEIINDDNEDNSITANENKSTLQANKVADQAFVIGSNNNKPIENAILMDPDNVIKQPVKKATKIDNNIVIDSQKENTNTNTNTNANINKAQVTTINNAKVISTEDNIKQLTKKAKKNEVTKNEPIKTEPAKTETIKTELVKSESAKAEITKNEVVKNELKDNKKVNIDMDKEK